MEEQQVGQEPKEVAEQGKSVFVSPRKRSFSERLGLGKVDAYIISTFLGTFVFCIALIISVSVVFDINEKIDYFIKPEVSWRDIIFAYYVNFVPYYANMFSPLFVFISVIFFTSKLADNSEIIAMMASGMSFKRILRPYFVAASLIALLTFVLNNYVIPPSNKTRNHFENTYIKNKSVEFVKGVHMEMEPGVFLFIRSFNAPNKSGDSFALESYEDGDLRSRLSAERVSYDTLGRWTLYTYRQRTFEGLEEKTHVGERIDTVLSVTPQDFMVSEKDVETMTSPQLSEYIDRQTQRGVGNAKLFAIELHKRYAAVFSAFILTFIGAVLSAKKVKNGLGLNIAIGVGLSLGYIFFMTVTSTFAVTGGLPPWAAAWLPNLVFVLLAFLLWRKAPK